MPNLVSIFATFHRPAAVPLLSPPISPKTDGPSWGDTLEIKIFAAFLSYLATELRAETRGDDSVHPVLRAGEVWVKNESGTRKFDHF